MTSWHGDPFCILGRLWLEFIGHDAFHPQGTNNAELWAFRFSQPVQAVEQTPELSLIWDAVTPVWYHCNENVKPNVPYKSYTLFPALGNKVSQILCGL